MNDSMLYAVAVTALVVADVLLVALAVAVYRRLRRPTAAVPAADPAVVESLAADVRDSTAAVTAALAGFAQRLGRIEERLGRLEDRPAPAPVVVSAPVSADNDARPYELANRLAARGVGVDELMELCGLARGEAELISRMQRQEAAGNE